MKSDKPFPETIQALLEMTDMSRRELGRHAIAHGWSATFSTLNRFIVGEVPVPPEAMEILARTLHIDPETFAEYRLWKVRRLYDINEVGFKEAVQNLRRLEAGEEVLAAHDPQEIARRLDDPGSGEGRAVSS